MEQNKALDNIDNRGGFIRLLDAAEIEKTNPFDLMRRFLQVGVSVYADLICVPLSIKTNPTTSDIQQELDKGSIEFGLRGEFWFPGDPTDHESSSVIEKIYLESLKCVRLTSATQQIFAQSKGWVVVKPLIIYREDFCRLAPKEGLLLPINWEFVQIQPEMTPILSLKNIWLPPEYLQNNQKTISDQNRKTEPLEILRPDALDNLLIKIYEDLMKDRSEDERPISQQIWHQLGRELERNRNNRKYDKEKILKKWAEDSVLFWSKGKTMVPCRRKTMQNRIANLKKKGFLSKLPAGKLVSL